MPPPPESEAAAIDPHGRAPVLPSLPEAFRTVAIPHGAPFWRKMLAFGGPGYLVAVGYMDPGNWATGIAGGAQFGYTLLAAVLLSNFVAIFLQALSLRLGVAGEMDLAQACRARFGPKLNFALWVTAEIAIIATDLAEVIGTAIALKLLFGMPLGIGVCVSALDALLILALQRRGFRYLEAFIIALVVVVGLCFVVELALAQPAIGGVVAGYLPSSEILTNPAMLYLALGIFGATVMPHNLYLHSAIAQTRRYERDEAGKREAIKFGTIDSTVALMLALAINSSIVILAASAFHFSGNQEVADLEEAHRLLAPLLGAGAASLLFAVALLASGQNSTVTGTMAGQIVMEGFLGLRMHPVLRRLLTRGVALVPALFVVFLIGEGAVTDLLILSQVVLSVQLGFAVVPLILFTSDPRIMGPFANSRGVAAAGFTLAAAIIAVNAWLVFQTVVGWLN